MDDHRGHHGSSSSEEYTRLSPILSGNSPSTSLLRNSKSLDRLTRRLGELQEESDADDEMSASGSMGQPTCCCGAPSGCRMMRGWGRMEEKLKLSGEIGDALLMRYESMERKHAREVQRLTEQLEIRKTALAESIKRVNSLERAVQQGKEKYSDLGKKHEGLEKRYTQSVHDQSLTSQSLSNLRIELTDARKKMNRQSVSLAAGIGVEERMAEADRRTDDLRAEAEAERRASREEERRRRRAEARISELEEQLQAAVRESEDMRMGRKKDAEELLSNAKSRLDDLHAELSSAHKESSPDDTPEYQRTLENLVASNTLLKHDAGNMAGMLAESQEEARHLREEVEELRAMVGVVGQRLQPSLSVNLASEISRSVSGRASPLESPLSGTEGPPGVVGIGGRPPRSRMSMAPLSRSTTRDQSRRSSFTPNVLSPGLGMGPIGEYSGSVSQDEGQRVLSPLSEDGQPSPGLPRVSPSGGSIGYVFNGMPKRNSIGLGRPGMRRHVSVDHRPVSYSSRPFSPNGVGPIAESEPEMSTEPLSPAPDYFAADVSRKRRSLMIQRFDSTSTSPADWAEIASHNEHTLVNTTLNDLREDSDAEHGAEHGKTTVSPNKRKVHRRTLLLLTQSKGVQTEADAVKGDKIIGVHASGTESVSTSRRGSVAASAGGNDDQDDRAKTGSLLGLLDHLQKILSKIRTADIATLHRRLRKQRLPGDVSHLSRTTLRNLQHEIISLRDALKPIDDEPTITRRELNLLTKLLRDVFLSLIDLQALANDMIIDHHIAKRLNKAAFREDGEEEVAGLAKQMAGGLGWVAAPLTKFFVTSPAEEAASPAESASSKTGRLQPVVPPPPPRAAPKQAAVAAATTTSISVEFGAAGIVRRAAPGIGGGTPGAQVLAKLPPSPITAHMDTSTIRAAPTMEITEALDGVGAVQTLRRSKSRGNRAELMGIFAGASRVGQAPPVPEVPTASAPGIRTSSSRYFSDRTIRPAPAERHRLPSSIDGMIDSDLGGTKPEHVVEPPLLQRTLRRRGLSDSSIRSTAVAQADEAQPATTTGTISGRQAAYAPAAATAGKKGYLGNFTSRFYPFRAETVAQDGRVATASPISDANPPKPKIIKSGEPVNVPPTTSAPSTVSTESKSTLPTPIPSSLSTSAQTQPGFLSILASSFVGGSESVTSFEESEALMRSGVADMEDARPKPTHLTVWSK